MNKTAAKEWLTIAYHDLKSAIILFDANHFTDSIGSDLQQSLEKILKSIIASQNNKIPKSHDLLEVYEYVSNNLHINDNEIVLIIKATEYYKEDRYPNPNYSLPPRDEIEELLEFTQELFDRVCSMLEIDIKEIDKWPKIAKYT